MADLYLIVLDSALKSAAILLITLLAMPLMRRCSAALRHLTLMLAMLAALALPGLSFILPAWRILPEWFTLPQTAYVIEEDVPTLGADDVYPKTDDLSIEKNNVPLIDESLRLSNSDESISSPSEFQGDDGSSGADHAVIDSMSKADVMLPTPPQAVLVEPPFPVRTDWPTIITIVWIIGAGIALLPLAIGHASLPRARRGATRLENGPLFDLLKSLRAEMGVDSSIVLYESDTRAMPMTWGYFSPAILLPADALQWSAERLRVVLLHELAHVKRRDCFVHLLMQLVRAVYWFNPLTWLIIRRMFAERELACDDLVLDRGSRPSDYAEHLLQLAAAMCADRFTGAAAISLARRSNIEGRLLAILDGKRNRKTIPITLAAALTFSVIGVTAGVAMMETQDTSPKEKTDSARIDQLLLAELDLSGIPNTSDPSELADLFVEVPTGSGSWEGRKEIEILYSEIDGTVFFNPAKDIYFVQRGSSGSSKLHYYGPITGELAVRLHKLVRANANKTSDHVKITSDAIRRLGSASFAEREAAQDELVAMGQGALVALRKAQKHEDPEIAARASNAILEIRVVIDERRAALREDVTESIEHGDHQSARNQYVELLSLPETELRDAHAAIAFFEQRNDWTALAHAYEVTAEVMWRIIHSPTADFIRVPRNEDVTLNPGFRGPTVEVQTDLDGRWHNAKGEPEDWVDWIQRKQDRMPLERVGILKKLARLCIERLDAPKRAVAAYEAAGRGVPFLTLPVDQLISQVWPQAKIDADALLLLNKPRTAHLPIEILDGLADAHKASNDVQAEVKDRLRAMMAALIEAGGDWNAHGPVQRAEAFWRVARRLPSDAIPPTLWLHMLDRDHPDLAIVKPQEGPHGLPYSHFGPNVVIRPGHRVLTLTVSAASLRGQGGIRCFTIIDDEVRDIGWVQWPQENRTNDQRKSETFDVPADAGIIRLRVTPGNGSDFEVHDLQIKARFVTATGEPKLVVPK